MSAALTRRDAFILSRISIIAADLPCVAAYSVTAFIAFRNTCVSTLHHAFRTDAITASALLPADAWRITSLLLAGAYGYTDIIAAFLLTGNATHISAGKEAVVAVESDIAAGCSFWTHISTTVAVFICAGADTIAAHLFLPTNIVATSAVIRISLQIYTSPAAIGWFFVWAVGGAIPPSFARDAFPSPRAVLI
jgi:hypothetical protein